MFDVIYISLFSSFKQGRLMVQETDSNFQSNNQPTIIMEESTCAICYESFENNSNGTRKAIMPCCEVDQASTVFCIRCIELICQRYSSQDDNIGKYPKCSQYIQVNGGEVVKSTAPLVECSVCKQKRLPHGGSTTTANTVREKVVCVACYIGIHNRLRYECERCQRIQMIPHPMYRYQEHPTSFSTSTWACHSRCHDYTRWRIIAADVRIVPVDDAPNSWGLQQEEIETIRSIRRAELQGISGGSGSRMYSSRRSENSSSLRSRLYSIVSGWFSTTGSTYDGNGDDDANRR